MHENDLFSQENVQIDRAVLRVDPFQNKDADVYTCEARSPLRIGSEYQHSLSRRKSIAFDYSLNYFIVNEFSTLTRRKPRIVEIYNRGGEKKFYSNYQLECITGIVLKKEVLGTKLG